MRNVHKNSLQLSGDEHRKISNRTLSSENAEKHAKTEGEVVTVNSLSTLSELTEEYPKGRFVQVEAVLQVAKLISDTAKYLFLISQIRSDSMR